MIKIDLHTHSIISPDKAGSITQVDYERFLEKEILNCIAITDHNETSFAQKLHNKWGNKIIVGEEITTSDGEMIGLFLSKTIPAGLSAQETIKEIRKQKGLVYIPHPFETFRKGIQKAVLEKVVKNIDILEVFNGRGRWRGKPNEAEAFAKKHHLVAAASSDAHGPAGIGNTFSLIADIPDVASLRQLLSEGLLQKTYATLWTYLYPMMNITKNKFKVIK